MSISLKDLLEKKYDEFISEVGLFMDTSIFSSQVDKTNINWSDYVNFIDFLFPSSDTKTHLNELLDFKSIKLNDSQIIVLVPILDKYLIFLRKVKTMM